MPAALPGAEILASSATGMARFTWEELELVQHWQVFLDDPMMYLRRLVGDQPDD